MKKLAAIFLITLFIFNLFGYRALFYFAQQQSDARIEQTLDNDQYNEDDLVTLKIPITLPYQVERKDFERFYGEINLNGKIYKYVKRKVCDGNLVLLCLPDHNKMNLEAARNQVANNTNDLQNTGSKSPANSKGFSGKNISNEYNQYTAEYIISFCQVAGEAAFQHQDSPLSSALRSSPEQPPELV